MEAGPAANGAASPTPSQPSLPLPVARPQNFRAHPQHTGWGQGHAPLGKQKQVPSQQPPSVPPRG